jgi:hypothetical protein
LLRYTTALRASHLAIIALGTADQVDTAQRLLHTTSPEELDMFVPVTVHA